MTPEREAKMRLVYRVGRPAREDDPGYIDDGRALCKLRSGPVLVKLKRA